MGHEKRGNDLKCRREQPGASCCASCFFVRWARAAATGPQVAPSWTCGWEPVTAATEPWEMGDWGFGWGRRCPWWLGTSWEGWWGAQGSLLPHLLMHGTERVTNPAVHAGTRTRTSKKRMFAGGNTGTAATQEPEQLTKSFSCCSLGPLKWHAKISPYFLLA